VPWRWRSVGFHAVRPPCGAAGGHPRLSQGISPFAGVAVHGRRLPLDGHAETVACRAVRSRWRSSAIEPWGYRGVAAHGRRLPLDGPCGLADGAKGDRPCGYRLLPRGRSRASPAARRVMRRRLLAGPCGLADGRWLVGAGDHTRDAMRLWPSAALACGYTRLWPHADPSTCPPGCVGLRRHAAPAAWDPAARGSAD
jgi:hypothetical protein